MRVEKQVLEFGIVEERTYDENDQLVDIRKIYPPIAVKHTGSYWHLDRRRAPGSSGGHEF